MSWKSKLNSKAIQTSNSRKLKFHIIKWTIKKLQKMFKMMVILCKTKLNTIFKFFSNVKHVSWNILTASFDTIHPRKLVEFYTLIMQCNPKGKSLGWDSLVVTHVDCFYQCITTACVRRGPFLLKLQNYSTLRCKSAPKSKKLNWPKKKMDTLSLLVFWHKHQVSVNVPKC